MSKKEQFKKFVREHSRDGLVLAAVVAGTIAVCIVQKKTYEDLEKDHLAMKGLCHLFTEAAVTGKEITEVFTNKELGKKVILRISEYKE